MYKAILKDAPQNGLFEYYLHKSTPKATSKKASVMPQFEFWREATRQITKAKPVSKGSTEKPWRGNTKLDAARPTSATNTRKSKTARVASLQKSTKEVQYQQYLAKVHILNQKKEFLQAFDEEMTASQR